MNPRSKLRELREAISTASRDGRLVEISRARLEEHSDRGYVLASGYELFLVALVTDSIRLEGFSVLRIADVTEFEHPYVRADFYERVLEVRGRQPREVRILLSSMAAVIRSAQQGFPLVTIHREEVDPEVCQIGRIIRVTQRTVYMDEIDPSAIWYDEESSYALREVTRVDFGGSYEEALALASIAR